MPNTITRQCRQIQRRRSGLASRGKAVLPSTTNLRSRASKERKSDAYKTGIMWVYIAENIVLSTISQFYTFDTVGRAEV